MSQLKSSDYVMPSDDKSRTEIKNAIVEASNALMRIDGERDFIKETANRIKDEHNMPPVLLKKLASIHHKQNLQEAVQKVEAIEDSYTLLFT